MEKINQVDKLQLKISYYGNGNIFCKYYYSNNRLKNYLIYFNYNFYDVFYTDFFIHLIF